MGIAFVKVERTTKQMGKSFEKKKYMDYTDQQEGSDKHWSGGSRWTSQQEKPSSSGTRSTGAGWQGNTGAGWQERGWKGWKDWMDDYEDPRETSPGYDAEGK
eukprot:3054104-Heterocapsa_arctica.AAC.1